MRKFICKTAAVSVLALASMPAFAQAVPAEDAISQAMQLAEQKKFDDALSLLEQLSPADQQTYEARIMTVKLLSWSGDYAAAQSALNALAADYPSNADVELLQANLFYYQGNLNGAETHYGNVLTLAPDYQDAALGLDRVEAARKDGLQSNNHIWRVDTMVGSAQIDGNAPDWQQRLLAVEYRAGDYSYLTTVNDLERFGLRDTQVTAQFARVARSGTNFALSATVTPDADFRPEYGLGASLSRTINLEQGPALQWSVGYAFDQFEDAAIHTVSPQLMAYLAGDVVLTGRVISVSEEDEDIQFGVLGQAEFPLTERFGVRIGAANAPEVINGRSLGTQSLFAGLKARLSPGLDLSLNYTNDDRQDAFDREGVNVALTVRR